MPIPEIKFTKLFINNKFVDALSGKTFPTLNPATEEVVALLPNSGPSEVEDAVRAAAGAFPAWAGLGHETRAKYLLKIADMIDSNLESLALAESRDQGKPVCLARSLDIPRAALNFRFAN